MTLIPARIADQIPELGSTSEVPIAKRSVYVRFHLPGSNWQWYVLEYDGHDRCWGFILSGRFAVPGEFSLAELGALEILDGRNRKRVIECDLELPPATLAALSQQEPAIRELLTQMHHQLVELES